MTRRLLCLLVVPMLAFAGAGCGGDDDDVESAADVQAFCELEAGDSTPDALRDQADEAEQMAPSEIADEAKVIAEVFRDAADSDDPEAALIAAGDDDDVTEATERIKAYCKAQGFDVDE